MYEPSHLKTHVPYANKLRCAGIDKRGLVIRTYTHTLNPQSTNELLEAFENGTNGAAYI